MIRGEPRGSEYFRGGMGTTWACITGWREVEFTTVVETTSQISTGYRDSTCFTPEGGACSTKIGICIDVLLLLSCMK